jgi:hypothetical protein
MWLTTMTLQVWANCCHVLYGSIITPLILQGKGFITDMDMFPQHFNSQKNAMNLTKENILNLMANLLKIQLQSKEHKTNSDNALQLDGIYNS